MADALKAEGNTAFAAKNFDEAMCVNLQNIKLSFSNPT